MPGTYLATQDGVPVSSSNPLPTTATLTTGDIEIGAVELKNATDDTRAVVGAGTAITEANNALAIKDASIGLTTDTDASLTVIGRLKKILATLTDRTAKIRSTDGTNDETTLFDVDSGAGSQHVHGVNLRKSASGGSVEFGTSTDPIRVDPTGTTTQPVDTELPAAAALADATANPTTPIVGAALQGYNGATWDRLRVDAQKNLLVGLRNSAGADLLASLTDGVSSGSSLLGSGPFLYNGTTWDKQRGNTQNTLLASAARTVTTSSADQTNYNARGLHVVLDVTSAGTGDITLTIEGKDGLSGKYYTLLAGTNVTANSTNVYKVYPGLPATANVSANDIVPRTYRVTVTANNANTITYSVASLLNL